MDATITISCLLVVIVGAALIFLVFYFARSRNRKAEDDARAALQAVLEPGEQLIEFTKANIKGVSATTALLTGWIGAAISKAGGEELYVGLTSRHLYLTPVKLTEESRSVQVVPSEDIKDFKVVGGMYGSSTLTVHAHSGDIIVYISDGMRWLPKAVALQKAFASLRKEGSDNATG